MSDEGNRSTVKVVDQNGREHWDKKVIYPDGSGRETIENVRGYDEHRFYGAGGKLEKVSHTPHSDK